MNDPISEQVSAFLDGELPENESELLLKRLTRDAELRDRFGRYSLAGEALRGSRSIGPTRDFAAGVRRRLDPEPAVQMPQATASAARSWWRPLTGIAVAAGVAAVAVVALEQRADLSSALASGRATVHGSMAADPLSSNASTSRVSLASRGAIAARDSVAGNTRPPEALSYTVPVVSSDAPALSSARLTNYVFAHSKYSSLLGQRNMLSGLIAEPSADVPPPKERPVPAAAGGRP